MFLGYCRVSTAEQAREDRSSLDSQQAQIAVVAKAKGYRQFDVAMFVDADVSGSVPLGRRPAGSKLLASVGEGDVVCGTKLDRLFRNALDALIVKDQIREKGAHLVMLDFGTDPITGTGMAAAQFGIMAVIAEWERSRIAERITEGKRGKFARGGHIGGEAPYGYRIEGSGREARLVAEEGEAGIVQVVREMSAQHYRPGAIRRALRDRGYRTRTGKLFQEVQVRRMMSRVNVA
jgi:putative DNA-invertase from lambdoid prophage Rac